jgi:hypothetical protein
MCADAHTPPLIIDNYALRRLIALIICYNGLINIQICLILINCQIKSKGK